MNTCRLIYRSIASADIVSNKTLADLQNKAAAANAEHGITGLLILSGRVFLQVLEGENEPVTALFGRILADKRHGQVQLVSFEQGVDRLFDDWNMRLVDIYDLPGDKRAFMASKYRTADDAVMVPDEVNLTLGFLLDAKHLCLSEPWKGREAGSNTPA